LNEAFAQKRIALIIGNNSYENLSQIEQLLSAINDACRNNPLTTSAGRSLGGTRGLRRSISEAQESKGTFSIYSAGYGQQAPDRLPGESTGVNSVFTRVFVKQLVKPGMTLRKLAVGIKENVSSLVSAIGHKQDSAYYDGIQGKAPYLSSNTSTTEIVKKNEGITDNPITTKEQPKEFELALWDSVRNSDDRDVISIYLKKYPNGFFADLAKVKY